MSKKAVAVVGGIAGLVGLGWLISRAVAKPATVQVALNSYPIRTILLIDDKYEIATPKTIAVTKGKHRFSAVTKSPDLTLTYGFHKWLINGVTVSHNPTIELDISRPCLITAKYIVAESGVYPIIPA